MHARPEELLRRTLSRGATVLLAVTLIWAPLSGAGAQDQKEDLTQPISYDFDSSDIDTKNKTTDFKNIVVSQGTTRIKADRAHGVALGVDEAFQDGRWTFKGNVRIDAEARGSTLRSDEAVVEFRDKHITTATATGKPAEFQQLQTNTGQLTRGHADLIVYDVKAQTVRLTQDAWLSDGQNTMTGPQVTYNIAEQRIRADSKPDKRVHITIIPKSSASSSAPANSGSDTAHKSAPAPAPEPRPQP